MRENLAVDRHHCDIEKLKTANIVLQGQMVQLKEKLKIKYCKQVEKLNDIKIKIDGQVEEMKKSQNEYMNQMKEMMN